MDGRPIRVLLIEDSATDALLLREVLDNMPLRQAALVHVERLSEGLQRLRAEQFDVILLDLRLPDSQGRDTFAAVYAHTPAVPIIILTGLGDESLTAEVLREGAQDYLGKDQLDSHLLERSIHYAIERQRASAQIQRLNAELEQRVAERTAELNAANEELAAFAYSAAHDLRTPLRSLDGYSQALLDDYGAVLDEAGQAYLQRIRANAQHMGQLIDNFLCISRVTRVALQPKAVDLSAMAQAIAADWQQREPHREVEWHLAPSLIARGDTSLLRIVLENLLANAWKFTAKQAHAHIEFGLITKEGQPVYFVRDNGVGFDMA